MSDIFSVPSPPTWDDRTPRGPATVDEALAVVRRSYMEGLGRRRGTGAGAPIDWPDAVPERTDLRQMAAWRLDPQSLAYAKTRATLEHTTLSAVVDRLLRQYAANPPSTWPVAWSEPLPDAELDPPLPGR